MGDELKKYFYCLLITLIFLTRCLHQQNSSDDLLLLIRAEQSFSKLSEAKGIRDAFLNYLADDAIVFRPTPVEARPLYFRSPAISGLLTWKPVFADIAMAGDLGYTTGPYVFRQDPASKQADGFGHYVSVWKKQADGAWRVILDCGIRYPSPDTTIREMSFSGKNHRFTTKNWIEIDAGKESETLIKTDLEFSNSSASVGIVAAFRTYSADEVRYYRMNEFPIIGRETICNRLISQTGVSSWEPIAAGVAKSGDLGFTYGVADFKSDQIEDDKIFKNSYLRIWKKRSHGEWKLVLDLANPIPENTKNSN